MNVVMETENQHVFTSSSSSPEVLPPENHADCPTHHHPPSTVTPCPGTVIPRPGTVIPRLGTVTPRLGTVISRPGTVIPNRIFVGGIDYKINESDLRHVFSQHGAVKEVKIVIDRSGMSKGYGFVTFETEDDALKLLHDADGVCFKDKKLSIGQAVRRQQASGHTRSALVTFPDSAMPRPVSCGTTSAGLPYIYHNGVAYFQCPNMSPVAPHWPPAPPVMLPQSHQPVYQQPAYQHHHCAPNQYQWNVVQTPMPPSPVVYSQQSEYLYQPADGGPVQPPLPVMEDTPPEFVEPTVLQVYPMYPPRTDAMTPFVLQHNPRKNLMFPHAQVHLKPKYRQFMHHKDSHHLPEAAEPPDASALHPHQPLM